MTYPWESLPYDRLAEAEASVTDAGYVRDTSKHVWVLPGTRKTAKVVRTENNKFIVQWG